MQFRIADTFTSSLARLTGDEQKAVKTTAFDLQTNPASPGMQLHKLDRARDKRFWSVRVNQDIRLIVHRTPDSFLLCYVDHHDKAYAWAERRKLETHPTTGAAQLVEIRETVREVVVPSYVTPQVRAPERPARVAERVQAAAPLLAHLSEEELLGFGVPREWMPDVRSATEETVLALVEHLPGEAAEAILELATGGRPTAPERPGPNVDPFEHPDAQRRFRVVSDVDELARALEYPWERWTVFLHPAQRELVQRQYGGPARVAGSAGTGKTIVALHRAVHLARKHPDARILLTTFSPTLANALRSKLSRLVGAEPRLRERLDVDAVETVARRLYESRIGRVRVATPSEIEDLLREAVKRAPDLGFSPRFVLAEWEQVVDAWQLQSWEDYRDVARLGRKTRLPENRRQALWAVFAAMRAALTERALLTDAALLDRITSHLRETDHSPYNFVVADEAQDLGVAQLRFLAALGAGRPDSLFFAGDLGQRIFQVPFSWKSLGVDVRGRSGVLRVNYRTSHQIRQQADGLLGQHVADVDGNQDDRGGTVSVFNGPPPVIQTFVSEKEEAAAVGRWLAARTREGVRAGEMAVLVRSREQLPRATAAVEAAKLRCATLDDSGAVPADCVVIGTMHLSKGLEYRAVAVMACDDEVLPLQERIESVTDEADLQDVYETERQLLYVACTRARDHLMVSGVAPASEFLRDLNKP